MIRTVARRFRVTEVGCLDELGGEIGACLEPVGHDSEDLIVPLTQENAKALAIRMYDDVMVSLEIKAAPR